MPVFHQRWHKYDRHLLAFSGNLNRARIMPVFRQRRHKYDKHWLALANISIGTRIIPVLDQHLAASTVFQYWFSAVEK
ncbi:unnamed protein product [Macrosiphum euphorbiae]|uniref:Uncharacterized protein n=1 Tax=Macrosiphum euphorbiae TaxID=13131 RepID=A0AAV0WPI6_9HEMI|nr:unnamed protein product [Macrosiphum euphorbiae]